MSEAITLWLIILIESVWMLANAILGRYDHVRATSGRIRSTLESTISERPTKFERKCRAQARRRRAHGIEL